MTEAWTIKDKSGKLLARYTREKRFDVEQLVLPIHYDLRRLLLEPNYRRLFEEHVQSVLDQERWTIVPVTMMECSAGAAEHAHGLMN